MGASYPGNGPARGAWLLFQFNAILIPRSRLVEGRAIASQLGMPLTACSAGFAADSRADRVRLGQGRNRARWRTMSNRFRVDPDYPIDPAKLPASWLVTPLYRSAGENYMASGEPLLSSISYEGSPALRYR